MKRNRIINICLFLVILFSAFGPFQPVERVVAQGGDDAQTTDFSDVAAAGKKHRFWIRNATDDVITLKMSGPMSYKFTFKKGTHPVTMLTGTYNYTLTGCKGKTTKGKILIWDPITKIVRVTCKASGPVIK